MLSINTPASVQSCYDKTANEYAEKFYNELDGKHLDKILLSSFAAQNSQKGKMIDLGCGPGQTTAALRNFGVVDIVGTDLSPVAIEKAKQLNQSIHFEVADMLNLRSVYAEESFGSAVGFYAIVHFNEMELMHAFGEIARVLKPGGHFLFSFHVGEEIVHLDNFLGHDVTIDFYFHNLESILVLAKQAGFRVIDAIQRAPYDDIEHPTTRGYVWLEKINPAI